MSDETRELGVELGELGDELRGREYPAGKDELLDEYGDEPLELTNEDTSLEEILEPYNQDEYESYEDIEAAIMNMVGDEAIGRKHYSDRTPPAPGEGRQGEGESGHDVEDQQSF